MTWETPIHDIKNCRFCQVDRERRKPMDENFVDTFRMLDFEAINKEMMSKRMRDGAKKFGTLDWRKIKYSDELNNRRIDSALEHLRTAQRAYRRGFVDETEVRKRAADLANQAFMLADGKRRWR